MNRRICNVCSGLAGFLLSLGAIDAELPPPERLAPAKASLVVTIPDWEAAADALRSTSLHRALQDPALRPLVERIKEDVARSFQGSLSEKDRKYFDEFLGLLKGQATFIFGDPRAMLQHPDVPPFTFVIGVKDQAAKLADFMERSLKDEERSHVVREKIADGELITLVPVKAGQDERAATDEGKMHLAIAGEMLVAGFDRGAVEDVLRRRAGGLGDALETDPVFQADKARFFRGAKGWAWLNVASVVKLALEQMEPAKPNPGNPFAMALDMRRLMTALGLTGWKSLSVALDYGARGGEADVFLNLPAGERKGLFKLLETEQKASAPPTFVPGDVAKYTRWRRDAQELIKLLEQTAAEAVPPFAGFISMMIDQAGKAKNPDFDFRRQFIGNLGNDLISLQWAPKAFTMNALSAPPTLFLIGSGNPGALLDALVTAQSAMGMPGMSAKEAEFLGQRVVSLPSGVEIGPDGKPAGPKFVHVTTGRGYLVIGTDRERVEDFIRGGSKADSLAETAGFRRAAEAAGGLGTGWLFYQNPVSTMKMMLQAVKSDPELVDKLIGANAALPSPSEPDEVPAGPDRAELKKQIADYVRLLPDFDTLAKYMNFSIGTVSTEKGGILLRSFTPEPAER